MFLIVIFHVTIAKIFVRFLLTRNDHPPTDSLELLSSLLITRLELLAKDLEMHNMANFVPHKIKIVSFY